MRYLLILCLLALSCDQASEETESHHTADTVSPPGVLIVADSVRIPDPLNQLYFSVKILTNDRTSEGSYDLITEFGHNEARTTISFPRGGGLPVTPALKKGSSSNEFLVGFYYGADTSTFYDYFLIKSNRGNTEMKYLKSYTFE